MSDQHQPPTGKETVFGGIARPGQNPPPGAPPPGTTPPVAPAAAPTPAAEPPGPPTWEAATPPPGATASNGGGASRGWLFGLFGLVVVGGLVAAGYFLFLGGGADRNESLRNGVLFVNAEGTFLDPIDGLLSGGSGTGFYIGDGYVVTNNHVVGGSGRVNIFADDAQTDERNARIVGVSECSDIAVLSVENTDGLTALEWLDEDAEVGSEVRALGFPQGNPNYTVTRGVISRAASEFPTPWASASEVYVHDAEVIPGNSGGPLVDADGRVVAVNYASAQDVDQSFAIASQEAEDIVAQIIDNDGDIDSFGVTPQAQQLDEAGNGAVFVTAVVSGSPADQAGVQIGDAIVDVEGVPVGTNGDLEAYCDIVRTHASDDVITIVVVRDGELWRGQFNGNALAPIDGGSDGQQGGGTEGGGTEGGGTEGGGTEGGGTEGGSAAPSGFTTVVDDSGTITMDVPADWDIFTEAGDGGAPEIYAALVNPDDNQFVQAQIWLTFDSGERYAERLSVIDGCSPISSAPYDDGVFSGTLEEFDCGGDTVGLLIALQNAGDTQGMTVYYSFVSGFDPSFVDAALQSFNFVN